MSIQRLALATCCAFSLLLLCEEQGAIAQPAAQYGTVEAYEAILRATQPSPAERAAIRRRIEAEEKAEEERIARMSPEDREAHFAKKHLEGTIAEARARRRFKVGLFTGTGLTAEMKAHNERAKKIRPKDREYLTAEEVKRLRYQ